jgi:DNA gyrase/topoisomerase IV subunit A
MNFLPLADNEKITSVLPVPKAAKGKVASLLMVTKDGVAKKVSASGFSDVRRSGIIAIKLSAGDALLSVLLVEGGDEVVVASAGGQAIRFKEKDVREMGDTVKDLTFWKAVTSGDSDGFKGRVGIHEILRMNQTIKDLVMKNATASEIEVQAKKEGMLTMLEDGIYKCVEGKTTIEEVLRVVTE